MLNQAGLCAVDSYDNNESTTIDIEPNTPLSHTTISSISTDEYNKHSVFVIDYVDSKTGEVHEIEALGGAISFYVCTHNIITIKDCNTIYS